MKLCELLLQLLQAAKLLLHCCIVLLPFDACPDP
jgi:hypothetical protein